MPLASSHLEYVIAHHFAALFSRDIWEDAVARSAASGGFDFDHDGKVTPFAINKL